MLKNLIIVLVFGAFLWSCSKDDRPPKPNNLITKEKMADILFDLYIINAAKGVNRKVLEQSNLVPESYLLTKYAIDSTQFAESNNYWAFNTKDYNAIVESVKFKLANKKKQLEDLQIKEQEDAKRRRDSLRRNNNQKTKKDSSSIG
ncbi:DUF4296 domain-containing protein [Winogradskyella alexanderae]|uniref:DUF4296 domain-containing protein n=1 Tax=Winogradskyella alexanderae TaxID=2877123 RepID=A0ABS7XQ73_9FLAO|nr:DUF4296 domain-containing protein [Winogradskyella alexanderae]MCA0131544.1 DUF4296 domain-containing protein [Winogradskyella alexanderae]